MPSTTSTPPPPATAEALSDLVAQVSFDEHYPSVDEVEGEQRHHQHQHSMEGGQQQDIALRAVVTTKEAGVIIGKEGRTVSGVREVTGVKVGVSKVIPRIHERTLTVSGPLPNVAKAFALLAEHLIEAYPYIHANDNPSAAATGNTVSPVDAISLRLLVSHQLVGSVIGKSGSKIREIQDESGAKIVVSKEMLPQSTERLVEIYGVVDSIHLAVYHVGKALLHDIDRGAGVILFEPQHGGPHGIISSYTRIAPDGTLHSPRSQRTGGGMHPSFYSKSPSSTGAHHHHQQSPSSGRIVPRSLSFDGDATVVDEDEMAVPQVTKNLSVPADMVGCLIGRGGSLISHIRRTSGARLHVSEQQEGAIERVVTIAGSDDSVTKALQLIYSQLENEKERREQAAQQQQETPAPSNPSEVMAGGGSE